MATWDSADLLLRCKDLARRPDTDAETTDAQWYRFLTEGQRKVYDVFMVHFPNVLYGDPVLLTTADGGLTYTFGTDADGDLIVPMGKVEVRESRDGDVLLPATDWDEWNGDFVHEGDKIRIPNGRTRTFSSGPYARFVTPPGVISATTEPTLRPKGARILIVYQALIQWASKGGMRETAHWDALYQKALWGDPRTDGDVGILSAMKLQFHKSGAAAEVSPVVWYKSKDLVNG